MKCKKRTFANVTVLVEIMVIAIMLFIAMVKTDISLAITTFFVFLAFVSTWFLINAIISKNIEDNLGIYYPARPIVAKFIIILCMFILFAGYRTYTNKNDADNEWITNQIVEMESRFQLLGNIKPEILEKSICYTDMNTKRSLFVAYTLVNVAGETSNILSGTNTSVVEMVYDGNDVVINDVVKLHNLMINYASDCGQAITIANDEALTNNEKTVKISQLNLSTRDEMETLFINFQEDFLKQQKSLIWTVALDFIVYICMIIYVHVFLLRCICYSIFRFRAKKNKIL